MPRIAGAIILSTLLAAPLLAQVSTGVESDAAAESTSWYPRTITGERGSAIIYAPQIDGWEDFETLTAWAAFSITKTGSETSYCGSLKFNAHTDTDITQHEVLLHDIEVLDLSIDGLAKDSAE